jgi:hypothetical protein
MPNFGAKKIKLVYSCCWNPLLFTADFFFPTPTEAVSASVVLIFGCNNDRTANLSVYVSHLLSNATEIFYYVKSYFI